MKTYSLIIPLCAVVWSNATVRAAGTPKQTTDCCEPGSGPKAHPQKVAITGSLIPAQAGMAGKMYAHTISPVVVITRADLQRMGARDVADALHRGVPRAR